MAQTKPVSVPVLPGMREEMSEHLAPPGTLRVARNVRFPVGGEVHSRRGTRALPIATSAAVTYAEAVASSDGPDYLAPCPGGFVFGAAGFGYRYDFAKGRVFADGSYANAVPKGKLATIASEESTLGNNDATPWPLSQAVGGGYIALVWSGGSGADGVGPITGGGTLPSVKLQIYTEGGTLVFAYTTGDYSAAWVVFDDSAASFVLVVQNGTAMSAAPVTLSSSGASLGAFVSVGSLTTTTAYWAATGWGSNGWALAYQSGATTATVKRFTGTTTAATQTFTTAGIQPISAHTRSSNLYVGWVDVGADNDARCRVYNTGLTLVTAGTVNLLNEPGIATLALTPPLFADSREHSGVFIAIGRATDLCGDAQNNTWLKALTMTAAGSVTGSLVTIEHAWPVSAPFNGGMIWCRLRTPNDTEDGNSYTRHALLDFTTERFPASISSNLRLNYPVIALLGEPFADLAADDYRGGSYRMHLCAPVVLGDEWVVGLPRLVRSELVSFTLSGGLAVAEWLRFQTEVPRMARPVGSDIVVAGSPVLVGNNHSPTVHQLGTASPAAGHQAHGTDLGFAIQPPQLGAVPSTGTGDLTLEGYYQYRAVLEWIDPEGRRWRSKPSLVYEGQLSGTENQFTHDGPRTHAWLRQNVRRYQSPSGMVIHLYRTEASGSTFYRCTPPQGAPLVANGAVISYVDGLPDFVLATREVLYTDGGVLDNEHAASCQFLAASEDRAWVAGLWDTKRARSSKLLVPGEPIQFTESPAFDVALPVECMGIASQDGNVILFGEQAVYAVLGGGPTDQGQGAWDSPRVITRSTGCVNGRSLLESSAGVFFQSRRGIELLPRGLGEPQFIGDPVQETFFNAGGEVLSAAVITSDEGRTARFCIGGPDVLVFDLDTGAWSLDRYPHNVTAICDTEQGAVIAFDQPTAGGYGFLLEESTLTVDAQDDVAVPVASELEWAAIHPFTIAGWGRFNCAVGMFDELQPLGYQDGNCSLFVSIDNHTDVGATFDMQALAAPDYRKHTPAHMNGSAVRLKLTTEVAGWRFMGWTLDLDDHGGSRRMAASEAG